MEDSAAPLWKLAWDDDWNEASVDTHRQPCPFFRCNAILCLGLAVSGACVLQKANPFL